jgi:addiction module HigA family antidote
MATTPNQYNPDYAVPPGWLLEEHLEARGFTQAEFARRCGRSPKLISEIISSKAPVEPATAVQFEKVLGLHASIWMGIENRFRLHQARKAEAEKSAQQADWLEAFPVKDLVKRGYIEEPDSDSDATSKLLTFFGVASVDAWARHYEIENTASQYFEIWANFATWRRLGELEAEKQEFADYDKIKFKKAVQDVKKISDSTFELFIEKVTNHFNQSGVAFTVVDPLPNTKTSFAAWWMSSKRPIILINSQFKFKSELWSDNLDKATHTLMHNKKSIFVDDENDEDHHLEAYK